ncbi:hypothetical protein GR157_23830 [Burkholderia sp. 4701]|nr:hypothetical protein [Burkholderia sp. 4701]MXN84946.1 hypothetical protein [Burkholderia sp. 4812]
MNQGKKSVAHRSTPFGTQNRRVLQAAGSTICGAIARGAAAPAGGRHEAPMRSWPREARRRAAALPHSIVVAFTQQKLSE